MLIPLTGCRGRVRFHDSDEREREEPGQSLFLERETRQKIKSVRMGGQVVQGVGASLGSIRVGD